MHDRDTNVHTHQGHGNTMANTHAHAHIHTNGHVMDLNLADLKISRQSRHTHTNTNTRTRTHTLPMCATMRILSTRNMQGIRLHLQEPYVTVEIDGQKTASQPVDKGDDVGGGLTGHGGGVGGRQYQFSVMQTSIIRVCVCDWTSDSRKGITGLIQVAVANMVPASLPYGTQILQKDWFAIHDSNGAPLRTKDGVPALEILLNLDPGYLQ